MRIITALIAGFLLSGCQNSWEQFYTPLPVPPNALPYSGTTECYQGTGNGDEKECYRNGFFQIGYSSFNSGRNETVDELKKFGQKIGADLVLYISGNQTTTQSSMAIPQYNPGQNQTTFMNGYSSNGTSFYGTANSYSYGTYSTAIVPVTITRRDYAAGYFRKLAAPTVGMWIRPLDQNEVRNAGTNNAVMVHAVRRDSPASRADILENDIILELDGKKVTSSEVYRDFIEKYKGQKVNITILRNGKRMTIALQLGQ